MSSRKTLCLILLGLVAALVYANGLRGEFLYDDQPYITKNPQVTGEQPLASVFTQSTPPDRPHLGLYRPVFILTLRMNRALAEFTPLAFHGTNIGIHILVIWMFFLLLHRLHADLAVSFLGALLFAVHPVHVEAVTWIVGRAELLSFLFCLLCALAHFKAREQPLLRIVEGLCFTLAILSKENAVVLPLLLWVLDRFTQGPGPGRDFKGLLAGYAHFVLIVVAVVGWRYSVLGRLSPAIETAPFQDVGGLGRGEAALASLAEYLRIAVFPYPLKIFYHISEIRHLSLVRGFILLVYLLLLVFLLRRKHPAAAWLLWIPLSLLSVLNLIPIGAVFAERFFYLPSAGACAVAAMGMLALIRKEAARRSAHLSLWLPLAVVLTFGVLTFARNPAFDNSFNLWKDAVSKGSEFAFPHYNLGECYFEKGILEFQSVENPGAAAALKESLRLKPDHPYAFAAHYRLGQYYLHRYKTRADREAMNRSVKHLEESIRQGPPMPEAKWKPALILVQIALESTGRNLVSIERAQTLLDLARSFEGPQDQITKLQRALDQL